MSKLGCHGVNGTFKAVKGHRLAPLRDTKRLIVFVAANAQVASVELPSNWTARPGAIVNAMKKAGGMEYKGPKK